MNAINIRVTTIIEPDDDGFHAYCPAFPGLHIDGPTIEETKRRTIPAIELYLVSLAKHGDPIPVGPHCVVEGEKVTVSVYGASPNTILEEIDVPCPSLV